MFLIISKTSLSNDFTTNLPELPPHRISTAEFCKCQGASRPGSCTNIYFTGTQRLMIDTSHSRIDLIFLLDWDQLHSINVIIICGDLWKDLYLALGTERVPYRWNIMPSLNLAFFDMSTMSRMCINYIDTHFYNYLTVNGLLGISCQISNDSITDIFGAKLGTKALFKNI